MRYGKVVAILIFIASLAALVMISGCTVIEQIDPCEREYTDCVHDCGEGILSGICKEGCTYERNECQKP